ncbi:MAG: thioesterase family protein [Polyangiaceae bacterium]
MYAFDADRRLTRVEPGRYAGGISARWDIGTIPNGGFVLALGLGAVQEEAPGLAPLTVTGHYLRPFGHGALEVAVERIKEGKRFSTFAARMLQGGREHLRLLATFGQLDLPGAPRWQDLAPPEISTAGEVRIAESRLPAPPMTQNFEVVIDAETGGWLRGDPPSLRADGTPSRAELSGRIRFADGRAPDLASLSLFADAVPPPALVVARAGWVPTLELTVHHRAVPVPGWLRFVFRTHLVQGGYLEEDGELWDEAGTLVAMSRQLALSPT